MNPTPNLVPVYSRSVSVIVCAYTLERWNELRDAVNSLLQQTVAAKEIIVVIDHNRDLFERTSTCFPGLTAVENAEPTGLAGARNTGAVAAGGEIVAFLDDDAVAEPDWIEKLLIAYDDPNVMGVGGATVPEWGGSRPVWFPREFNWVVGCSYLGMSECRSRVRNMIGANMSFRRQVFDHLRFYHGLGYGNGRTLGGEETDLCIRVKNRWPDRTFVYQPDARVRHRVSNGRACWSYFRDRCFNEGLSKAVLTRRVGSDNGLASERAYTLKTLPRGVARGLADTFFQGDPTGVCRSAAIVFGFTVTVAGYAAGTAMQRVPDLRQRAGIEGQESPSVST